MRFTLADRMSAPGALRLAAAAVFLMLAGCGSQKTLPFEPSEEPPDPTATFTRVQNEIFTTSCARASCHAGTAPAGGMDLSPGRAFASIVGVTSTERNSLPRIEPGQPDRSYLIKKVRGDADISGARMPVGGALDPAEVALLVDWVRRGAPQD